jgi:hypothetical protein
MEYYWLSIGLVTTFGSLNDILNSPKKLPIPQRYIYPLITGGKCIVGEKWQW